jgi:glycosyltransferase involved in cell wall biosynthesis
VARLGLQDTVVFTGEVKVAALKSYYLLAKAFMLTSRHEGFCVPLVESMAMKVPIVAYASSAVADTAGEAGLIWEEGNPQLLAKSLDVIVNEESVAARLGLLGTRRYEQMFTNPKIEAQFLSALSGII